MQIMQFFEKIEHGQHYYVGFLTNHLNQTSNTTFWSKSYFLAYTNNCYIFSSSFLSNNSLFLQNLDYFIIWNFKGAPLLDACCLATSTTRKAPSCDQRHEEFPSLPLVAINVGPNGCSDTNLTYTK